MNREARFKEAMAVIDQKFKETEDEEEKAKILVTCLNGFLLTKRERAACRVLSHLQHDGEVFLNNFHNDLLMTYCAKILRVDPMKLFEKIFWPFKNDEP